MSDAPQPPPHLDKLGQLCQDGLAIAQYLYQVPDDEGEIQKARDILKSILANPTVQARREFPKIATEMMEALDGEPNPLTAGLLQEGFERMIQLSQAAKSGLMFRPPEGL